MINFPFQNLTDEHFISYVNSFKYNSNFNEESFSIDELNSIIFYQYNLNTDSEAYKDNYSDVLKRLNRNNSNENRFNFSPLNKITQIKIKGNQSTNLPLKIIDHEGFELKESRSALRNRLRQGTNKIGFSGAPPPPIEYLGL